MDKTLYILKGETADYDYTVFGIYTSKEALLKASVKVMHDFCKGNDLAQIQDDYGFSGLLCYVVKANDINKTGSLVSPFDEHLILWHKNTHKAILK